MRFSIVKIDKNKEVHLSVKPAEWFLERIQKDTKAGDVAKMRDYIDRYGDSGRYESQNPVAQVLPSVELEKTSNGVLRIVRFNGLVTLHIDNLLREDDRKAVKEAARMLPMTFAAFVGADGRSIEVLVSVCQADGTLPPVADEQELDRFCQSAYSLALATYGGILPYPVVRQYVTARSSFRMTLDEQPYHNAEATPLRVSGSPLTTPHSSLSSQPSFLSTDMVLYADYERMYERAVDEAIDETAGVIESQREEAYITELARRLCLMGVPEEETFLHIRNHHVFKPNYDEDTFRAIVSAVYYENKPERKPEDVAEVSLVTRRLIHFLNTRYVFRYNTVMGYTEFRPNNTWIVDWKPCDVQAIFGMTSEARLANLDVRENDVRRHVFSDRLPQCDPLEDYLFRISGKWDGKTDHIGMLARTVPCDFPQWEKWFRKWFLAMVAQWMGRMGDYGNSLVPLLISKQGDGKSTFCRQILPPELQWGFYENMTVKEDRATLQAMHNFLLINLDEFNKIPAKVQSGFLKNIIQLPNVKFKRPYGKHVEEFSRKASFIAATNEHFVLSDPTGSRRFIVVQLTGLINVAYRPNYEALYDQAQQLVRRGEQYWLTPEEMAELTEHNSAFQQMPNALMYFYEYYDIAAEGDKDAKWISATDIFKCLKGMADKSGARLEVSGPSALGRLLHSIPGILSNRINRNNRYWVKEKPAPSSLSPRFSQ